MGIPNIEELLVNAYEQRPAEAPSFEHAEKIHILGAEALLRMQQSALLDTTPAIQ